MLPPGATVRSRAHSRYVELHHENGLAHPSEAGVDAAALVVDGSEPFNRSTKDSRSSSRPAKVRGLRPAPGVSGLSRLFMSPRPSAPFKVTAQWER